MSFELDPESPTPKSPPRWTHSISAVAFDMDGLMVNTETLYTQVGEMILERRGRRFTTELKNQMMGLPGDQAFQIMIQQEQLSDTVESLAKESDEVFREILPTQLSLLPGLLELLAWLDDQELPRCVATSSSISFARTVLALTRLSDRFDFVITAQDVPRGKPSPDIYIEAARRMAVHTFEMLVLEDSHHGSRAGITSGACTIAIPGEHSRDHDFSGVHLIADSLADPLIRQILARGSSARATTHPD